MNKKQCMTSDEIDNIVDGIEPLIRIYSCVDKTIGADRAAHGKWDWIKDFDNFWEDALSIFAEQFSKDEQ